MTILYYVYDALVHVQISQVFVLLLSITRVFLIRHIVTMSGGSGSNKTIGAIAMGTRRSGMYVVT